MAQEAKLYADNGNPALQALNSGLEIILGTASKAADVYTKFKSADQVAAVAKAQAAATLPPPQQPVVPVYTGPAANIDVKNVDRKSVV